MKTLVRPILHTSILDMLASGLQAYCLMVAWWLLHFQTSLVYTTAVTSKMEGSQDFSCSSLPFHQERQFYSEPLTVFINLTWQKQIPRPPVTIRDTGQVGTRPFSHCHWRPALPSKKRRTVTGPTSAVSDALTKVRGWQSACHFRERVSFALPWGAAAHNF